MPPRKRRSHRELFLDKLRELTKNDEQKLIGNMTLRDALNWDDPRYNRIKAQLRDENFIIAGTGKGGSVGLADARGTSGLRLFISYSHADEALKDELIKHIEPLKRLKLIESWHDRKLLPGDDWEKSISKNMENADIILFLVSIDFINSEYCFDIELDRALELQAQQKTRVIPIILRSCLWQYTSFGKIQALPRDAKAVSLWPTTDDALTDVADGIRKVAEEIRASR